MLKSDDFSMKLLISVIKEDVYKRQSMHRLLMTAWEKL